MKNTIKAVLLSALVFPGLGHLLLKRYRSAAAIIGAAGLGLYYLFSDAYARAMAVVEKIQSGEIQPDIAEINRLLSEPPSASELQVINLSTCALVIAWLLGAADAYRVGRARDKNAGSTDETLHKNNEPS